MGGSSAWLSDIMRLKRSATGRSACPWEAGPYPFLATCRSSSPAGCMRLRPATVGEHSTPLTLGTCSTGLCFVMLLPVAVFSAVLSGLCWMAKMRFCPCGYRKVGCTVIWPCDQCTDLRGQVGVVRSGASGGSPKAHLLLQFRQDTHSVAPWPHRGLIIVKAYTSSTSLNCNISTPGRCEVVLVVGTGLSTELKVRGPRVRGTVPWLGARQLA